MTEHDDFKQEAILRQAWEAQTRDQSLAAYLQRQHRRGWREWMRAAVDEARARNAQAEARNADARARNAEAKAHSAMIAMGYRFHDDGTVERYKSQPKPRSPMLETSYFDARHRKSLGGGVWRPRRQWDYR